MLANAGRRVKTLHFPSSHCGQGEEVSVWQGADDKAQVKINTKFDSNETTLSVEILEIKQANCNEILNTMDMLFNIEVKVKDDDEAKKEETSSVTVGPDWSSEEYRTDGRVGRIWRHFTFCFKSCRTPPKDGNANAVENVLSCCGKCPDAVVTKEEHYTAKRADGTFKREFDGVSAWEDIEYIIVELMDSDFNSKEHVGQVHLLFTAESVQHAHRELDTAAVTTKGGSQGWFPLQPYHPYSHDNAKDGKLRIDDHVNSRTLRISSTMWVRDPWFALFRYHEWVRDTASRSLPPFVCNHHACCTAVVFVLLLDMK